MSGDELSSGEPFEEGVGGPWESVHFDAVEADVYATDRLDRKQWMGRRDKLPFAPWSERSPPIECAKHQCRNHRDDGLQDDCAACQAHQAGVLHAADECSHDARFRWSLPSNYVDGETVAAAEEKNDIDGRTFIQQNADPYAFVDGDNVRCPDSEEVHPKFIAVLNRLGLTYADVSVSDTGVHADYRNPAADPLLKKGQMAFDLDDEPWGENDEPPSIEVYTRKHVCVDTGKHVSGTPTECREWNVEALRAIRDEYAPDRHPEYERDGDAIRSQDDRDAVIGDSNAQAASWDELFDILDNISAHDLPLQTRQVGTDGTGWEQWNPRTYRSSDSGESLHSPDGIVFHDHKTGESFTAFKLFAAEEDLIDKPWQSLKGTYREAVERARELGGPLPAPPTTQEREGRQPNMDAFARGGSDTARGAAAPDSEPLPVSPDGIRALAGITDDDDSSISDLNDRQKAACIWKLIRQSDAYHVRVLRDSGEFWAYDADRGVWTNEGVRALRQAARTAVGPTNFGKQVVTELKEQVLADPAAEIARDDLGVTAGSLAVANGLLDLTAATNDGADALRPLEPEDYALIRVPVAYDPEAAYDEWQALVEEWVADGWADALQEYVGYCLHRNALPIHRALLLVGSGANGKGTFLSVVEALLGTSNTTSIELQTLANERDAVADFYGSLANIDHDLSARSLGKGLGMFKKLVGGDPVRARHLYEDAFEFTPTGKHLYAANEVPSVNVPDDEEAFWRRWLLVEFPNHYPNTEADPDLAARFTTPEALSGVLNWAIQGWARLLAQGHFTNEEEYAHQKRERWQQWGESIDQFISEGVERDADADRITTGEAYRHYEAWCHANGEDPESQQQFTNKLKMEGVGYRKSVKIDGTVHRGYVALGFTDEVPALPDDEDESAGGVGQQQLG